MLSTQVFHLGSRSVRNATTAWRPMSGPSIGSASRSRMRRANGFVCPLETPGYMSQRCSRKHWLTFLLAQSNYLKDLPPEDLRDDDEALETFTDRLTPFLGDLISEHSKVINNAEDGRVRSDRARPLFKMVIAKLPAGDSGADFCFLEIDRNPLR